MKSSGASWRPCCARAEGGRALDVLEVLEDGLVRLASSPRGGVVGGAARGVAWGGVEGGVGREERGRERGRAGRVTVQATARYGAEVCRVVASSIDLVSRHVSKVALGGVTAIPRRQGVGGGERGGEGCLCGGGGGRDGVQ